jgi:YD repeat-containing protein
MSRRVSIALGIAVLLATILAAQEHPNLAKGAANMMDTFAEGDAVNLFNGNALVTIPLGQAYSINASLSYGLTLYYNARPWEWRQRCVSGTCYTQTVTSDASNAGLGWRASFGNLISPANPRNTVGQWIYEAPDGSQHVFYPTLHDGDTATTGVQYTRDATYLRLKDAGVDGGGSPLHDMEAPDGTIRGFSNEDLIQLHDRFGNYVNFTTTYGPCSGCTGGSKTITVQDQHGRTHYVKYQYESPSTNYYLTQVDLAGFNGTRSVYNFGRQIINMPRGCGDTDPQTPTNIDVAILSSMTLPDGSSYAMPTYQTDNTSCQAGLLRQLRLPTLGSIEWDYQTWTFTTPPGDTRTYRYSVPGVLARRLRDAAGSALGTWSYQTQLVTPPPSCLSRELVNSVTTPKGDLTKHYFSVYVNGDSCANTEAWTAMDYALPLTRNTTRQTASPRLLSTERFTTAAGTQLLRTTFVNYEREAVTLSGDQPPSDRNRRLVSFRTAYNDDSGHYADTDYTQFDGLGHFRQKTTNGNFDNGNGNTTFTNFNPGTGTLLLDAAGNRLPGFTMLAPATAWVLDTYTDTSTTENGVTFKRQYCFEQDTGFLLRKRTLGGDTTTNTDLLTVFTRDSNGNRIREQQYGGDNAWVDNGDLCTLFPGYSDVFRTDSTFQYGALHTAQYTDAVGSPLPFKKTDRDIDAQTGLTHVSRDSAGLATTYDFDGIGRIRSIVPQAGQGARTEYTYTAATSSSALARLDVQRWDNARTTVLTQQQVSYDSFGRMWKEKQLMPNGTWSTREHGHDAMGLESFTSELEASDPPLHQTQLSHDFFGRPTSVTAPDGSVTTTQYAGDRTVTTTHHVRTSGDASNIVESSTTTTQVFDRQGRLFQTIEPSRPDGSNTTTQYTYDANGNRTSIASMLPDGTQTRQYNYDRRGLLTWEQQPEAGAFGNGKIYYTYDAAGHRTRRHDDRTDVVTSYDRAMRPLSVSDFSGTGRVLKEYAYAASNNGAYEWGQGKLQQTIRHNYTGTGDTTVTESYTYAGKDGRLSNVVTTTNVGMNFSVNYVFDDLGNPTSIYYPVFGSSQLTVTNAYTNGSLTSVNGWATAITYLPNGRVAQVTFTNGASWVEEPDPWGMPRPYRISSSGGFTPWTSGIYRYDSSGNIAAIGTDYRLFDLANRVKEGTASGTYTPSTRQTYTYDTASNLTAKTTIVNGTSTTASTPVNWSTNRMTNASYDASGNLLQYGGGYGYEYDPIGALTAMENYATGTEWTCWYNANDQRIHFSDGANIETWTVRDLHGRVLAEFRYNWGSWTVVNYVYRGGTLLGRLTGDTSKAYLIVDDTGTPRQVIDANRYEIGQHTYYALGEEATPPDSEPLKLHGQERDFATDTSTVSLDQQNGTYAAPALDRTLTTTPTPALTTDPQQLNAYSAHGTTNLDQDVANWPDGWIEIPGSGGQCARNKMTGQEKCKTDPGSITVIGNPIPVIPIGGTGGPGSEPGQPGTPPPDPQTNPCRSNNPLMNGAIALPSAGALPGVGEAAEDLIDIAGGLVVAGATLLDWGCPSANDDKPPRTKKDCENQCDRMYDGLITECQRTIPDADKVRRSQCYAQAAEHYAQCLRDCATLP